MGLGRRRWRCRVFSLGRVASLIRSGFTKFTEVRYFWCGFMQKLCGCDSGARRRTACAVWVVERAARRLHGWWSDMQWDR